MRVSKNSNVKLLIIFSFQQFITLDQQIVSPPLHCLRQLLSDNTHGMDFSINGKMQNEWKKKNREQLL